MAVLAAAHCLVSVAIHPCATMAKSRAEAAKFFRTCHVVSRHCRIRVGPFVGFVQVLVTDTSSAFRQELSGLRSISDVSSLQLLILIDHKIATDQRLCTPAKCRHENSTSPLYTHHRSDAIQVRINLYIIQRVILQATGHCRCKQRNSV